MGDDSDDDEDYDVVEVTGGHNVSLPVLPSQPLPTIYDVPKSHGPEEVTRSRSSWSLDKEVKYFLCLNSELFSDLAGEVQEAAAPSPPPEMSD